MAMAQVGGPLRVILWTGAGLIGSAVYHNPVPLSELLKAFQEKLREKGDAADEGMRQAYVELEQLAMEVRRMGTNAVTTVLHVDSGSSAISVLIAPAAAAGALGYGYHFFKHNVSKQNMANAVSSMTKHLDQMQNSLAAAKRHLTQRIQKVDDKLDQQKELSGKIKDEVSGARLKLKDIGSEVKNLKHLAFNLDEKLDTIQDKQNFQLAGVSYLLQFVEPNGGNDGRLPDRAIQFIEPNGGSLPRLEGFQRTASRHGEQAELPGLGLGLRLMATMESANVGNVVQRQSTLINPAC